LTTINSKCECCYVLSQLSTANAKGLNDLFIYSRQINDRMSTLCKNCKKRCEISWESAQEKSLNGQKKARRKIWKKICKEKYMNKTIPHCYWFLS
jgi:DNA polymerase III psi subunit